MICHHCNEDTSECVCDGGISQIIREDEPLVLSLTGTADQMRVWLHLAEQQEPLVRQILSVEPKADLEDIQIWFMSAEEHGQPHTVEEFVEWFKLDDEGNPK